MDASRNDVSAGTPGSVKTIPHRPRIFPALPGDPANISGVVGKGPTTPAKLKLDQATGQKTGGITLPLGVWIPVDVDRPTIVVSRTPDDDADGPVILYNYGEIPQLPTVQLQTSERTGTCFLSEPGKWWLNFVGQGVILSIDCLLIDAQNLGTVWKYMTAPGVNQVFQGNVAVASAVATTTIRAARRGRRALTIQNVPNGAGASANVRISVNQPSTYLVVAGAWTGQGIQLLPAGSLTLEGEALGHGKVLAVLEAAGASAIEFLEYTSI